MKFKIKLRDIDWWYWAVTLVFIIAALIGITYCYYIVIAISGVQVLHFLIKEKSLIAFPTQVRIVYFAFTLFGFWENVRFYMFILLLLGTLMVTFFGKCVIAKILIKMPWNKDLKSCTF